MKIGRINIGWRERFYLATGCYFISILTIVFSLPDSDTVYGDKDCLQVLAEREIEYRVNNSKYKEWFSYEE